MKVFAVLIASLLPLALAGPAVLKTSALAPAVFNGVTYTPVSSFPANVPEDQKAAIVAADMSIVNLSVNYLRLYSTDGNCAGYALDALATLKSNVKVHIGLWVADGESRYQQELTTAVALIKKYPGRVASLSVGNEAIFHTHLPIGTLIGYINALKANPAVKAANIPVGTFDITPSFVSNPSLVAAVDFIGINIQPDYSNVPAGSPGSAYAENFISQFQAFQKEPVIAEAKKPIIVGEVGHATNDLNAFTNFFQSTVCLAAKHKINYNYFEFRNAMWKSVVDDKANVQTFGILTPDTVSKVRAAIVC
ncbi:hypothetical protein IWQ60_002240 [Tieghemiomyces parasiticus]|uniref:glucan endo-1,3-beta-D-glucosidase n=1 Tax=Tieghemiomyces parasiticus TaxID=78921 RepID=A0A9W8AJB9_9FUNG|nr:hypothetical protein IWQ60_002240 [Tieghemiomyces parasiticus]